MSGLADIDEVFDIAHAHLLRGHTKCLLDVNLRTRDDTQAVNEDWEVRLGRVRQGARWARTSKSNSSRSRLCTAAADTVESFSRESPPSAGSSTTRKAESECLEATI